MTYRKEFEAEKFGWWSGGKDTFDDVKKAGKTEEFEELVNDWFSGRFPTETEINDFAWFSRDWIYECLGMSDGGND